ncbi:MAG TPA: hypothetical protein PKD20_01320 [Candidatus Saccharibacteria bacterium]|jgi:hypothetical protein|nr:hypothetical protein [Candidatus Saccharibacteria bacterium]HMT55497.1 hypothetical protein [Candidatus Saccharibacteria bacterium]
MIAKNSEQIILPFGLSFNHESVKFQPDLQPKDDTEKQAVTVKLLGIDFQSTLGSATLGYALTIETTETDDTHIADPVGIFKIEGRDTNGSLDFSNDTLANPSRQIIENTKQSLKDKNAELYEASKDYRFTNTIFYSSLIATLISTATTIHGLSSLDKAVSRNDIESASAVLSPPILLISSIMLGLFGTKSFAERRNIKDKVKESIRIKSFVDKMRVHGLTREVND